MNTRNKFINKQSAINAADYLKSKYGKDIVVFKELDGIYSLCGVTFYLVLYEYVEFVYCTNPNYDTQWQM